jgi:hypothetical protein
MSRPAAGIFAAGFLAVFLAGFVFAFDFVYFLTGFFLVLILFSPFYFLGSGKWGLLFVI